MTNLLNICNLKEFKVESSVSLKHFLSLLINIRCAGHGQ